MRFRRNRLRSLSCAGAVALAHMSCATRTPALRQEPPPVVAEPRPEAPLVARLTLLNPRLACGVAALKFSRGDEVLAVLGPDDKAEVELPLGSYVITVNDGRGALDHAVELGAEGALLSPGCFHDPFAPFGRGGLLPLTLVGPDVACATEPVRARAGGLLIELAPGERETLYLPRATHVVRVLEKNGRGGRDITVELSSPAGAELPVDACTAAPNVGGP